MRPVTRTTLSVILCLGLAGGLVQPGLAGNTPSIESGQKELGRVRARIQALQERMQADRGRQDELQQQVEDVEGQIARTQDQLRSLRGRIDAQQRQVESSRAQEAEARSRLAGQRGALARQLRAAYMIGNSGQIKLVLNQEDVQKVGRVLAYYDYLNKARSRGIQEMLRQIEQVRGAGERLRASLDSLTALRAQHEETLQVLARTRAERARAVQRLAERLADAAEELKGLEADERRVQELLENLRDVLADIPVPGGDRPFAQLRGHLPWPLRGGLLAQFGQEKAGGKFSWRGLWIEAAEGTPVKAVARGRIAYAGWMQRYGLIVILEHPGNYYSLYGHLQRVPRSEGEWVNGGETLALAGNTGGYDKHGVYFEIRKGREPVNPAEWLVK